MLATNAGSWLNVATLQSSIPPDNNSQNNTASASVTVNSITNPPIVLNCSSNLTANATSASGATVFFTVAASGGCSPPPMVNAYPPSGSTFPVGTTTVLVTASDTCGNSTNCSFTVTVVDPPIALNCSSNITVTATSSAGAMVFFTLTASGGCSPPPMVNAYPPSGSTFPIGTTMVNCTASDGCGGSTNCSFEVTVIKPPITLNCSSNIAVTAISSNGAAVFFTLTASGGCSPPPMVNAYPPSGSTFPIGTTTVNCTASDTCGGTTNCSFTVTVNPPVYPPIVLNCSSNIATAATSSSGAAVFFTVTASGGCSPPTIMANPPSGSTFPIGTNIVLVTASDACGNSTNCNFTVTVASAPIVLNCSTNITATAASSDGAVVYFETDASGGCAPLNVVADPPSGSVFPVGLTEVTVTASDACGNSTNCGFTVIMEPPNCMVSISCPTNIVVTSAVPIAVYFSVNASDLCGVSPAVTASPASGSIFPIGTTAVWCEASDANGGAACSFTVTVVNTNTPILLNCSSNIVATATSTNGAAVFFTASASGGCSPPPTIVANPPSGSTFPVGETTVSVTASDACGDSTNCSFVVQVVAPPINLDCPSNITTTATSVGGATVFYSATASGGCSTPSLGGYPPSGSTFPVGATTVSLTASDGCGNSTNCSFVVTVVPTPIVLNCPSNITATAMSSSGAAVFFTATASGGCSTPNISAYPPSGSTFPVGTNSVSLTASDSCGNSANCSFIVTVVRPPIVLNCPSNITLTATSSNGAVGFYSVTASGGCSTPTVTAYPPSGSTFPVGVTTVFTAATDHCDTWTNCSFTVTVLNTNPPASGPGLSVHLTGTNHILLTWPVNPTLSYSIAQILSLGTTNWRTLSNLPTVVGNSNQLMLVLSNTQSFFRLISTATSTPPCMVSLTLTNCDLPESVTLTAPSTALPVSPGNPVNLSATLNLAPALLAVVSYYTNSSGYSANCPDTFVTNVVSPTILASSWTVQGPGSYTAGGSGLNAVFTPTDCGSGTVHFITTWQHVCDAGQSTAYVSAGFAVNCASTCRTAGVTTNCLVSGSMALTNTTAGTNFCFGSAVTASGTNWVTTNSQIVVTTTYTNASGAVTTNCPPMSVTNTVAPTVVSNWWTVSGPGNYTNSGAGLTATFTPTNGGSGQITFYLTYSNNAPCNPKPVTISTAPVGFNVIQITNLCVADTPTNQNRTTIGVGEVVELSLAGLTDGPYTWSTTAGAFGFDLTNGVMTTLTAPPRAATATVSVNYPGGSCSKSFTVIEPSVETAVINKTNTYAAGKQGAGMYLIITVGPTTVSFANVEVLEVPGPATTVTGYFTNYPAANLVHKPNPNWIQLNEANLWADTAAFSGYPKPWYAGGFQWVIPVQWRVVGTTNVGNLPNRLQVFSINGTNGSSTVSKLGQSVTRIP